MVRAQGLGDFLGTVHFSPPIEQMQVLPVMFLCSGARTAPMDQASQGDKPPVLYAGLMDSMGQNGPSYTLSVVRKS
jgi:hypothetical protein